MIISQIFKNSELNPKLISQASKAFQEVLKEKEAGDLPVLNLPAQPEKISELEPVAHYFRQKFETVVVLGTGGSSLGGQSLVSLSQDMYGFERNGPRLIFLDNIDPDTFDRFLRNINFEKTGFIVISKSGNTAETLCQLSNILTDWENKKVEPKLSDHFLIITEKKKSLLSDFAKEFSLPLMPHDAKIGGRFAALSLVGLLPAMIAGLDAKKILKGAQSILDQKEDNSAIKGSAWMIQQSKCTQSVMMPYCDRLFFFCKWYRQLWAESLGKDGKGLTPIAAYGTVDQHSQLQLYLDGPKDKTFTILSTDHSQQGLRIGSYFNDFSGKSMGDLMQAEQQSTIDTLVKNNCPTRVLDLSSVEEEAVGALMMHFMLETMITAKMIGVNAFDQPAVEQGKVLAKKYLEKAKAA